MKSAVIASLLVSLVLAAIFVSGCATTSSVDWSSRVGHYTYAQAVNELGPPDRQIRLSTGATEFRWYRPSPGSSPGMNRTGITYHGMNNGFGTGPNSGPGFSDHYLQLTFDANGVLTAWLKNY